MKHSDLYFFLTSLVSLVSLVSAGPTKTTKLGTKANIVSNVCLNNARKYLFNYTKNPEYYYDTWCNYPPALGTTLLCLDLYSKPYSRTWNKTVKEIRKSCVDYANNDEGFEWYVEQYQNATKYIISTEGLNLTKTYFTSPFNVTLEEGAHYYKFLKSSYYEWDQPNLFAGMFYVYFLVVFIVQGLFNLFKRLGYFGSFTNNKFIRWYKSNIGTPALFNDKHADQSRTLKIFTTLVPTRVESLVVTGFIFLNIVLSMVKYDIVTQREGQSKVPFYAEFIADRTGLLSFGLIPLLVLFAGRNNLLIQATGIPYASFIVYHKWVSRFMFLYAMIHSACWTEYAVYYGYLKLYYEDTYWIWGAIATVSSGLIIFQAFHMFRSMSYETFLAIHIVLACIFMAGCFWHCYDLGYLEWLYASWALWIVDRVVRVGRILWFGSKLATVESVNEEIFKVSVPTHQSSATAFPGSFAYLYFMTPYGFWQSHPFTCLNSVATPGHLVFTIKAKRGMTKYLQKKILKSQDKKLKVRVGVEGPYGHRAPLEKYNNVLLIGGGSGLPGLLAHALDLSSRDSINKQIVKLVWVIKHMSDYDMFADELSVLASRGNVEIEVYVTAVCASASAIISGSSEDELSEKNNDGTLVQGVSSADETSEKESRSEKMPENFHSGRPDIAQLINTSGSATGSGSLAIMSCGPPKMCDQIRAMAAEAMGNSDNVVDFFDELQVW
ncbi:Ferric reductase transmembrane component 3 [Cyberlindnera fabianii]|uniref:ferric-chelate reductase (NADPH) n=1 Tax=Cyberlindnera fabianii TaxID=36022 RepID=A0A1V2L0F7_CYBFA|nr:Ferric reductase transmembrane component 3 [Cyberlindnera fabianii]